MGSCTTPNRDRYPAPLLVPENRATRGGARRARALPRGLAGIAASILIIASLAACGGSGSSANVATLPALHPDRTGPQSMFTPGSALKTDPIPTIDAMTRLGVQSVQVYINWSSIAPDASSFTKPAFDATDPDAYPAAGWATYDTIVRRLAERHITVNASLTGTPPYWAEGPGDPARTTQPEWKPNVPDYEDWVKAVATRYSGHFIPSGQSTPLPRIDHWSSWNEPNLGINLAPETLRAKSPVEVAPRLYRSLLDAAWTALHATGHGHDQILIGELAPVGGPNPGLFSSMTPLRFLRALYCVGADLRPLRGTQAAQRGCPTTGASAHFAAGNPALFKASGVAVHPYSFTSLPPDVRVPNESEDAELAAMPTLESTLDHIQRAYGSGTRFPIWSTEFGYITNPPNNQYTVTPAQAAYYLNWSQYLTWEDPRLLSYDQYLLADPSSTFPFATGLRTSTGKPKPTLAAYRMPLYLPVTTTAKGHPLVVWGQVRPAPDAAHTTHRPQTVQIQFRPRSGGSFTTVGRVRITNPNGYIELHQTFSGSGSVRLRWAYPDGEQIFSRTVAVTLN
jgi:hypothetical protein